MPRWNFPKTHRLPRSETPVSTGDWLARRLLSVPLLFLWLAALWFLRPQRFAHISEAQAQQTSCLSNMGRIGLAFAQYAQDYDGKFPRGTDAEDRFNVRTWQQAYNGYFSGQARNVPLLPEVLAPYLRDSSQNSPWHCPADNGWDIPNLPGFESGLINVRPSAYEKFGLSYGYLTLRAFAGLRVADMPQPSQAISIFDSSLWHRRDSEATLNMLFADGHVSSVSSEEFQSAIARDELQLSSALQAARFQQKLRLAQPRTLTPTQPRGSIPRPITPVPLWTPPPTLQPPTLQSPE
jgi:prepilin-type processing-associated H-X9-DG protein